MIETVYTCAGKCGRYEKFHATLGRPKMAWWRYVVMKRSVIYAEGVTCESCLSKFFGSHTDSAITRFNLERLFPVEG